MTGALLKKQLMEVFSWLYQDKKSGKHRSRAGLWGYGLIYLILFCGLGSMFFFLALTLCETLENADMGWLYWCLMGLIGICLGVFGSVFNTYASLYQAGDNDLLLSMPIPAGKILLVRLLGVYVMGLLYELLVMVPAVLVWFLKVRQTVWTVFTALLTPLLLSVLILVLSAVLGWVVALVTGRMKRKNFVIVAASLLFIVAYYYCYSKAYTMLQMLLMNPDGFGGKVKLYLYPLYLMGLGAEGRLLSFLIFGAIVILLALVCYTVLSRSLLKLVTTNCGSGKKAYIEKQVSARSVRSALLHKEFSRFFGSANYMLNCGMGCLMMPLAAVLLLWKGHLIQEVFAVMPQLPLPLLGAAAVCTVASMNDMAAPSVSLEGKNLWIVRALPVSEQDVLMAKLSAHLILTLIPAIPLVAAVEWILKPGLVYGILIPLASGLFISFMGALDLAVGVKLANLNWTSEIIPIKQSAPVAIALLGGWGLLLILAGLYYLIGAWLGILGFLLLVCGLLLAGSILLLGWLLTRGSRILAAL